MSDDDARLTDFVDHGETQEDSADSEGDVRSDGTDEREPRETTTEPASGANALALDPPTATSRWEPDGAVCTACGTTADRLWQDGEAFVCPTCKDW